MASLPLVLAFDANAAVWRADELARASAAVLATGHAALDAQLPGGGWPVGALVEILQAQSGQNEWRLLLPALARARAGPVLLVGPPHMPFVPGLAAQGLACERLLWITAVTPASRMWASEQALRCAEVAAVLAWLPQARADQLRRLQMAASEHAKLLFVMRPASAQAESSPAVLRLLVAAQPDSDALRLELLKRRGPPCTQPLVMPARSGRLSALLARGRTSRRPAAVADWPQSAPPMPQEAAHHVLDSLAGTA
ncbi:MAG: translesion DNA synthesis-associated protein ImuA [Rhodoferax sp.]|nr:translesion DNA synthesis-associated protein ImuA [Rhodoferax sp.]